MSTASMRLMLAALIFVTLAGRPTAAATPWEMVKGGMTTDWAGKVSVQHPLPEYPRPQLVRPQWTNLNGLWEYAVTAQDAPQPTSYAGRILVPFAIESALSGVKKPLEPEQRLWYRRRLATPDLSHGQRVLLHFGAVDWQARVFVNGKEVGGHQGGYDGFTIDITDALKPAAPPAPAASPAPAAVKPETKKTAEKPADKPADKAKATPAQPSNPPPSGKLAAPLVASVKLAPAPAPTVAASAEPQSSEKPRHKAGRKKKGGEADAAAKKRDIAPPAAETNELVVSVWDPTNTAPNACGKQSLTPKGTRYTASSGIWQTVWLETVPAASIDRLEVTPDVDRGLLTLVAHSRGNARDCTLEVVAKAHNRIAGTACGRADEKVALDIQEVHAWQPDDPYLYELTVALKRGAAVVDQVSSYAALRKIEVGRDAAGHERILLNGRPLFSIGLLDQGFWPDGGYTAPTDEALRFDVEAAKKMGFNTIRKHVKVEPDRWYYHCDRAGMLVWQDMPCRFVKPAGSDQGSVVSDQKLPTTGHRPLATKDTPEARRQFESELQAMLTGLGNHPSIVMWVLFNEGWGAYDVPRLAGLVKQRDPTRLVNAHTGGPAEGAGDVVDIHSYCYGHMPPCLPGKASVLGELGGVAVPIAGHEWEPGVVAGQGKLRPGELGLFYEDLTNRLRPMIALGLCGAIYTQPYDLESEANGLMTFDRKVHKVSFELLNDINRNLLRVASVRPQVVVPTAQRQPQTWRYTTQHPKPEWNTMRFDDAGWTAGAAPFGNGPAARTRPAAKEVWLRRTITLHRPLKAPCLDILAGGETEVYVDGRLAALVNAVAEQVPLSPRERVGVRGSTTDYNLEPLRPDAALLLTAGRHLLAIHGRLDAAGALDAGLSDLRTPPASPALVAKAWAMDAAEDLHLAPGGKWLEHDMLRPRPPVVDTAGVLAVGLLARAPSDAVVLFDGKDLSQWASFESGLAGPAPWKLENGYMEVSPQGGNIYTKQKFGDCQVHIEWASPFPASPHTGQGRGNSGVFPLGFGEIQVLDSWQNDTYPDGQAGGIYGKYPPLVNASRPSGQWQAYDIVFRMARLDKQGRILQPARMTMLHNGVVIHHGLELAGRQQAGTIGLQDHHDPVRYRNIWVRKLVDYDVAGTPPPPAAEAKPAAAASEGRKK